MASENPGPSTSTMNHEHPQSSSCSICRSTFYEKEILRLIFKESERHMTVLIIYLTIRNGVITNTAKDAMNYYKIRHDVQGFYPILQGYNTQQDKKRLHAPDCDKKCDLKEDGENVGTHETDEKLDPKSDGGILISFLKRLAANLNLDMALIQESIEHILTSCGLILLDLDLQKLRTISKRENSVIKDIVKNMFWQPKAYQDNISNVEGIKTWFSSVDKGYVVPCYGNSYFGFPACNPVDEILLRCAHDIERYSSKFLTWYLEPYFYDNDMHPRVDTYTKFLERLKRRKITNSLVRLVYDNPLSLGSNFAYVVDSSFHTNQKYLNKHMCRTILFNNEMVYIRHEIPFIVRTRDPITHNHIFNMILKDKVFDAPTYENLFRLLVLLRDVMVRMQLSSVAMPKIGEKHDQLDFPKVLKMISYVFRDSHINVVIGLGNKRWFWIGPRKSSNSSEEQRAK